MAEWVITDHEIEASEKLLLPEGSHFADDAREVIRCWHSTDVAACPGSGKTTVLLAKLKLLADRMPLKNGAGICVLSHTNVAVDEIKARLSGCADKLLGYPNFIGTIQSFVDRFVTMQYLRGQCKTGLQFVSTEEYGRYLYNLVWHDRSRYSPYNSLRYFIRNKYQKGSFPYANEEGYYQNITIGKDGIYHGNSKLAGFGSDSGKQFLQAKWDLLINKGILLYNDTYAYANDAIEALSEDYTDLFSKRFKYVFIDEYQDCDDGQRAALSKLFDERKCCVIRIGDSDQAIFNGQNDSVSDWIPQTGCMTVASSCRYSQEIADVLVPLRKSGDKIVSSVGTCGYRPVIIVFDKNNPECVVEEYVHQIISRGLNEPGKKHYAIGFRREASSGLAVGSYWNRFEATRNSRTEAKYWPVIDDICKELKRGKLYRAESITEQLVYRIFRELEVINPDTEKPFSHSAVYALLKNEFRDSYSDYIYQMCVLENVSRETVDGIIKSLIATLLNNEEAFGNLSDRFLDRNPQAENGKEKNLYSGQGVEIRFDTIHAVKGQTHSSTLYLETMYKNGSDLARILPLYGAGRKNTSPIYDYSRKLAYVAMSRPRHLLCVAMQSETYEKSNGVFDANWEIVDLRKETEI